MSYQVRVAPAPTKYLAKLRDESLKRRIVKALRILEADARPSGCVKLQGNEELYRIRAIVLVVEIGHRCEIYRT